MHIIFAKVWMLSEALYLRVGYFRVEGLITIKKAFACLAGAHIIQKWRAKISPLNVDWVREHIYTDTYLNICI